MKGLAPLILGIFGTFSFSWVGLTVIPNLQIGHLNPQMDEEGADAYPTPKSGMAERGRRVYVANGCSYCHTEQVRPYYAANDIDRKWGERRSAPRDYIFDRPVLLGKERMGPDLSNVGKRAPVEGEQTNAANAPITAPGGAASPAQPAAPTAPAPAGSAAPPAPSPAESKNAANAPPPPAANAPPTTPTAANAQVPAPGGATSPAPPAASPAPPPPAASPNPVTGDLPPYSAAWHHRHLYSPRSITLDSNMPAFRFLYEKHPIGSEPAANAVQLTERDAPPNGWEVIPTYEAECLVAYLMSLDQSHPLKEVKSATPVAAPSASPAAPPPAAPPAASPPPPAQPPK